MERFEIMSRIRGILLRGRVAARSTWTRFRRLKRWQKALVIVIILALLWGISLLFPKSAVPSAESQLRTVELATLASLSGSGTGSDIVGTVRAVSEADIVTETGGSVRAVHASLGTRVPAGAILAEFDNASERAALLTAQGTYEAAVAARSSASLSSEEQSAENVYRSAYGSLDTAISNEVDLLFTGYGTYGPLLAISANGDNEEELSREHGEINKLMDAWRRGIETASSRDAATLLSEAESVTSRVATFIANVAAEANRTNSTATAAQRTAIASARATADSVLASVTTARQAHRAGSVGATLSADAGVKQALGSLRAAEASLEKTFVRAPISGVVNYLPLRTGSYVASGTHVATVAENETLEILAYASSEERSAVAVGTDVTVEGAYRGTITAVSPALDPATGRIELRIALSEAASLENGESVRVTLPGATPSSPLVEDARLMLPLAAVKLRPEDRVIFTVDEEGRLVAREVEIGAVRGSRIEILTPLSAELLIVTDARGLAEGEEVNVAGTGSPSR